MAQNTLFKMPSRPTGRAADKKAVGRTKSRINTGNIITIKGGGRGGGNNIILKIKAITELVNRELGAEKEKYQLIMDEGEFRRYMAHARKNGVLGLDTETDGLNWIDDQIAGVCIYTPDEKPAYVPINHINYITGAKVKGQIPKEVVAEELRNLQDVKVYYHNAKFDIEECYWQLGVEGLIPYWDTMLGGFLLNENEPHNLKYLYEKYVVNSGKSANELATYEKLFEGMPFTRIPLEVAYLYAAKDPYMTYVLGKFQEQFLDSASPVYKGEKYDGLAYVFRNIEMPLIPAVANMESNGVKIDEDYAEELSVKYNKLLDKAQSHINDEYARLEPQLKTFKKKNPKGYASLENPINVNSPKQLAILLYDVLGLKSPDKDKPRGTGEEIIETFKLPITKAILEYRGIFKLLSTYIEKLPAVVNQKTGKVHGSFNQYGAATGRFSSSDPNLQNIPSHNKDIRKMFVAENGWVLIGGDYSQQEPRCLAHFSGDENLIKAYNDGKDIYATIASMVYKLPYEDCLEFFPDGTTNPEGKKRRGNIKGVVLGIMYGRGAASIASELNISKKEAQNIIDEFFTMFPKVKAFVEQSIIMAKEFGYVTTICGRKRRLPDIQLPKYEFSYINNVATFNPFFDDDSITEVNTEVPEYLVQSYSALLNNTWKVSEKNNIKAKAKAEGIKIKDNGGFIAQAERQCVNARIQGSSADMTKLAIIHLYNNEELRQLQFKLLLTVHDEIIGTCPKENARRVRELIQETMIGASHLKVPMKCDIEITEKWYGEEVAV